MSHRIARHVRNFAMGSTAAPALKPPPHRIWRAELTNDELTAAGFSAEADGWEIIKGLLRLKGIPEAHLQDGAAFKCTETDDVIVVEFG